MNIVRNSHMEPVYTFLVNKLQTSRRIAAISALVEGVSITGVAKQTVLKLLKDLGCAAAVTIPTSAIYVCAICSAMKSGLS